MNSFKEGKLSIQMHKFAKIQYYFEYCKWSIDFSENNFQWIFEKQSEIALKKVVFLHFEF